MSDYSVASGWYVVCVCVCLGGGVQRLWAKTEHTAEVDNGGARTDGEGPRDCQA